MLATLGATPLLGNFGSMTTNSIAGECRKDFFYGLRKSGRVSRELGESYFSRDNGPGITVLNSIQANASNAFSPLRTIPTSILKPT